MLQLHLVINNLFAHRVVPYIISIYTYIYIYMMSAMVPQLIGNSTRLSSHWPSQSCMIFCWFSLTIICFSLTTTNMSDIHLAASTAIWWTRWGINLNYLSGRTVNSLRPRRNGHYKADDIFKCIFLKPNVWIPTKISLKFVPKGQINNIPALVQRMAWRRPGDKPLSWTMMVSLLTHICVTRPQWVKYIDKSLN